MGMFDFRVTPDEGDPFDVEAAPRDVLVWERTNKNKRVFSDLLERTSLADMYHLAHVAARRQGLFEGDLRAFEASCDVSGAPKEEPDPTGSGQSPGA